MTDFALARIGYARVSTTDQDQILDWPPLNAGCEIICSETDRVREWRTELETIMQFAHRRRAGRCARLARLPTRDVLNPVHELMKGELAAHP